MEIAAQHSQMGDPGVCLSREGRCVDQSAAIAMVVGAFGIATAGADGADGAADD